MPDETSQVVSAPATMPPKRLFASITALSTNAMLQLNSLVSTITGAIGSSAGAIVAAVNRQRTGDVVDVGLKSPHPILLPPPVYWPETWSSSGRTPARNTKGGRYFGSFVTVRAGISLGSTTVTPIGSDDGGLTWYPCGSAVVLGVGATTAVRADVMADLMALQLTSTALVTVLGGIEKTKSAVYYS